MLINLQIFCNRLQGASKFKATQPLVAYIKTLGVSGMSDDESNSEAGSAMGNRVYTVTRPEWRSSDRNFIEMMRVTDLLFMSSKYKDNGCPARGNWPRIRRMGKEPRPPQLPIPAPQGLPRNFYDEAWLGQRSDRQLRELDVKEPISFKVPKEVKEYVRCHLSLECTG